MPSLSDLLETPENATEGLLVVTMPRTVPAGDTPRRAFLSDNSVNRGPVLERFIEWFSLWDMPLARVRGHESALERAFALTLWPEKEPAGAHGPQFVKAVADQVPDLLAVLKARRPRLVIFLSAYLWQAITTPEAEPLTTEACGRALDAGRRVSGTRLAVWVQKRERCVFLALPLPSKNTTDAVVKAWASEIQRVFASVRAVPDEAVDPQIAAAAQALVLDPQASVQRIAALLHVSPDRAKALYAALEGRAWTLDRAGRNVLMENR